MAKPSDEEQTARRDAAAVTKGHEDDRAKAARDVADRNRKAHDKAVKSRKRRDRLREDLKDGLEF
jgi:hypothetical protein